MNKETQTMTQKVKATKRVGRPKGRKNRLSSRETIERALSSGKELTEIKDIIEHYIEHAETYELTVKQILDFLKADVDLHKWMHDTLEKMDKNKENIAKGKAPEELPEGQVGSVVAFSLKAAE
jgi:hypothetical protein